MTDPTRSDDTPLDGTSDDDILDDAYLRFKRCQDREATARSNIADDMRFAEGDARNNYQWPDATLATRNTELRPALTNNLVRQHCLQIVNDARQHKPGIEVRATGSGATYEAAKVFEGICRHIEYESNAQAAYDTAAYHQVYGGRGWWRVVTEYGDDDSFDQVIRIKRVPDPMSVYLDPDIQEYDGSDAKFGFAFVDWERREFEKRHPDLVDALSDTTLESSHGWVTDDHVRVAEFYRRIDRIDWLTHMPDGSVARDSKMPKGFGAEARSQKLQRRRITTPKIEHFKLAAREELNRTIWPGFCVPLVRCMGEETLIDGQLDIKGHTRAMISAQQMHNYFYSAAVEHVALQGKTPYIGPAKAFEGYEEYYEAANTTNLAFLPYNHVDDAGAAIQRPERAQPPVMAQAFIQGLNVSSSLILDVSGQHQASLGEPSNEKSGVAIQQRQRQGDNATAHYIDHQASAVRFTGRILIDLIPKVYDTARVLQILGEDGTVQRVQIDPTAAQAHQQVQNPEAPDYDENSVAAIFNPTVGKYSVVADIGPSFATKRQDAFNAFSQIMQNNPEAMKIGGDLLWLNADFPGADQLAARWRRTVPTNLLSDNAGPPPEMQQMQQHFQQTVQQGEAEIAQLKTALADAERKLKDKGQDLQTAEFKAATDRLATVGDIDPKAAQTLVRQMFEMLHQQNAVPLLAHHAAVEAALDAVGQPPAQQMPGQAPDPTPAAPGATDGPGPQP